MARNVPTPGGAEIIDVMLLRKAIGVLGVALPFLLWFGGLAARVALQPSISRYYHTQMHDAFVGVLCAIGLGLFAYRGYLHPKKKKWWENRAANVAAAFAVGTAIFAPGEGSAFWNEITPLLTDRAEQLPASSVRDPVHRDPGMVRMAVQQGEVPPILPRVRGSDPGGGRGGGAARDWRPLHSKRRVLGRGVRGVGVRRSMVREGLEVGSASNRPTTGSSFFAGIYADGWVLSSWERCFGLRTLIAARGAVVTPGVSDASDLKPTASGHTGVTIRGVNAGDRFIR